MSQKPASTDTRIEQDFLGEMEIPAKAYWGIHAARAVENFPITRSTLAAMPELIVAFAHVKKAAAKANHEYGLISAEQRDAIVWAAEQLITGKHHKEFVVDVIQGCLLYTSDAADD